MSSKASEICAEKLGEVRGTFHADGLTYRAYSFGQGLVLRQLTKGSGPKAFAIGGLLGIALFSLIVLAVEYLQVEVDLNYEIGRFEYSRYDNGAVLFISHYVVLAAVLLGVRYINHVYRSRLMRKVYSAAEIGTQGFDVSIGDKGVLVVSHHMNLFSPWEDVIQTAENKAGLFLLTKRYSTISIPSSALAQALDKAGLVGFIQDKMRR